MSKKTYNIDNLMNYENAFLKQGKGTIAGMDEVGRGCLAGPVVVACVVMPLEKDELIIGVDDSKKLSKSKRESLNTLIWQKAKEITIFECDNNQIDTINILEATKLCMLKCINAIQLNCDVVLVDAVNLKDTKYPTFPIIKGDALSYSIAAASIVAKVYRDNLMKEYDAKYPQYGFASHVGYGTAKHIEAIKKYGVCDIHRKTFLKRIIIGEQLGLTI